MSKKKKVMIIAHFCDYGFESSNNRFNYLANLLSQEYEVKLVTSSFSHRDKSQRVEVNVEGQNYLTKLIYEPSYEKNISLKRLFISHCVMAENLRKYLQTCDQPDIVYCAIPSINVSEVVSEYTQKRKIPFVIDVQDLWPEAYRLVLKDEKLYNLATGKMKKRINKVYEAADQIVAVSDSYAKRAKSVNTKCHNPITVYLGTERTFFDNSVQNYIPMYRKPDNEFWLGYCGTLGHSYDLTIVMEAMRKLADSGAGNIRLIAIGSGPLGERFMKKAKKMNVPCTFTGKLAYGQMCAQLSQCDIAVNPIKKGSVQSIINKHADYAMAGLPVVNTQECKEYQNLLKKFNCGINCNPNSVNQVAEAILLLFKEREICTKMQKNARAMGEEKFERSKTYRKILEVIRGLL